MKIIQLTTERVRNLPDQTWTFDPAFQIIHGLNEAGKSALHEAIRIGLYGDAKSTDQRYVQARRWRTDEGLLVKLRVRVPDGEHEILRDFEARKNVLILPDGSRPRGEQALEDFLRRHLPLPTERSFLATACVRQDELATVRDETATLQPLLEQHALSGVGVDVQELTAKLDRHLMEVRRGVDRPAPKNPGPIARLRADAQRLTTETTDLHGRAGRQAEAAAELTTIRQQLQGAEAELNRNREHLARHQRLQQAEDRLQGAQQRIDRARASLDRVAALQGQIPTLDAERKTAHEALTDYQARLDRAERHHRLTQEAAAFRQELEDLEADLQSLAQLDGRLAEILAARSALALSRDDLKNLRALPEEIRSLGETVRTFDAARGRDATRKATAEGELTEAQEQVAALETEKTRQERALGTAEQRARLQATLDGMRQRVEILEPRLARLQSLSGELETLTARRQALAVLDNLADQLPELPTRIQTMRDSLAGQGIEVRVSPQQPLDLTVRTDDTPSQRYSGREPVVFPAARRMEIAFDPWFDLEVRNLNELEERIESLEAELIQLLSAAGCASVEEAHARIAERDWLDAEIAGLGRQLAAELGTDTPARLEAMLAGLQRERAQNAAALEGLPVVGETPDALREAMGKVGVELATWRERAQALGREIAGLTDALTKDPVAAVRAELQRKQSILQELVVRLGPDGDAAAMEAQHGTLEEQIANAQETRAEVLKGRRPEDLQHRTTAHQASLAALTPQIADLSSDALTNEALEAARAHLITLHAELKTKEEAQHLARGQLAALDEETLRQEQAGAARDSVVAEHEINDLRDFRLSPQDRLQLEGRVRELEGSLPALRQRCGAVEERATAETELQNRIAETEERLETIQRQLHDWERRLQIDEEVVALIEAARARALADLSTRRLPQLAGGYLARVTGTRHGDVRFEDGGFRLYSEQKQNLLLDEEFSGGTRDQFYLAVRLAYLEALFPDARPPLLLDDPLVHCDPQRRAEVLRILAEYARSGQVLLFTCHDFAEYASYPVIQL